MAKRGTFFQKTRMTFFLLSHGHAKTLFRRLRNKISAKEICYGFRRDLYLDFEPPNSAFPVQLRFFEEKDRAALFGPGDIGKEKDKAVMDRLKRLAMLEADIPQSYVGTTPEGAPCFIQWLIPPAANRKLLSFYQGYIPPLSKDEVLLEGVFIPDSYRGKRIMPLAMSSLAEKGRAIGARWAVTYVEETNLPSIKGVLQSGFRPYLTRISVWRMFRRTIEFIALDEKERTELEAEWSKVFKVSIGSMGGLSPERVHCSL